MIFGVMIGERGQVTIPKKMRERYGLMPGTQVEFVEVDGHLEVRKDRGRGRGRRIVERMRGQAGPGLSTDEIMAMTRGED